MDINSPYPYQSWDPVSSNVNGHRDNFSLCLQRYLHGNGREWPFCLRLTSIPPPAIRYLNSLVFQQSMTLSVKRSIILRKMSGMCISMLSLSLPSSCSFEFLQFSFFQSCLPPPPLPPPPASTAPARCPLRWTFLCHFLFFGGSGGPVS